MQKAANFIIMIKYFIVFLFTNKVCRKCALGYLKKHEDVMCKDTYKCDNCQTLFI